MRVRLARASDTSATTLVHQLQRAQADSVDDA
jgi:hypothetical protein